MASLRLWLCGVAVLALGIPGSQIARADSKDRASDRTVLVRALVVHAEKKPGQVDWICEKLRKKLEPMNFGTLRVMQRRQFKLRFGESGRLTLPGGREVRFLPISVVRHQLHMQVEMPGPVNTRMRMMSGRGVILGGVEHGDGYLIVHMVPNFRVPRRAYRSNPQIPGAALHRVRKPAE